MSQGVSSPADRLSLAIADIAEMDASQIELDMRVAGDLGLDSLAVAEVMLMLEDDFDALGLEHALADADWDALTLRDLLALVR